VLGIAEAVRTQDKTAQDKTAQDKTARQAHAALAVRVTKRERRDSGRA
jgi:hypothetical protein